MMIYFLEKFEKEKEPTNPSSKTTSRSPMLEETWLTVSLYNKKDWLVLKNHTTEASSPPRCPCH